MVQRGRFHRRSRAEWGVRLLIAASVGWVGCLSVIQALAVALPDSEIERAYALASNNGRVAARLSERLSGPQATAADRLHAVSIAKQALRDDAMAVEAVATLGIDAAIRGDQTEAKRLFRYSQVLSRRDLRTQLWAIEDAVARHDIGDALRHYDIALRTKKEAAGLLYPVLAGAITDRSVSSELIKTLAQQPVWAGSFVDHIAANGSDPTATFALFRGLVQARFPVSANASNSLISALITDGHFHDAWSYYSMIRGTTEKRESRDPRFTAILERPSPFDWVSINSTGISTAIQADAKGGIFDFAAVPSTGGPLLQQMQILPAGDYVLEGHSTGIDQPSDSRPYWALRCRGGKELGRFSLPNSSEASGHFSGRFTVPPDCPIQVLTFVARSSNQIMGIAGQIDRVLLHPSP